MENLNWIVFVNGTHKNEIQQSRIFEFEEYPTIEELVLELEYEDFNDTQKLTDRILLNLNSIVLTNDIIK